ncbi:DEAD/DEAH box helicase [uncultured Phocaeicola sp.]|uniref:DEAD/DEAH box helicase n=1 Tax=uncultured Phocaeicola sp. TaxID=990718 RepID=UPI0025E4B439|nr:DEAD/DEAH box helicase [uncultured Phocaeicola sp.]
MEIQLRDYQKAASDKAVAFFLNPKIKHNGLIVIPTGGGKSWVIADIANRLNDNVLIFCPSKEILVQNYEKMVKICPFDCAVYSASVGQKQIAKITFATIGSAINHKEQFRHFKYVLVDEAHLCNPKEGMYKEFFQTLNCKIIGLSATPYRLSSSRDFGSMLKFITRTRPCVFSEVIYQVQISTLLDMGYLSKLNYYPMNPVGWNELNLKVNTTGADYTDKSVVKEYERIDFYGFLVSIVQRLMNPKSGVKRKGILVFTRFLKEAERLTWSIPGTAIVSGETPKKERERILEAFKSGEIPVVANVGVLTTGFDYPELDTIVMARPTMSLALWYQIVGRAIRPHPNKETGWIVDLCGNIKRFGEVKDLRLVDGGNGKWAVYSNNRQLTNVRF